MIDTAKLREEIAAKQQMLDRYEKLTQCVKMLEARNDLTLDITELDMTTSTMQRPPAVDTMESMMTQFIENEWSNGNLQDQFMSWMADAVETLERNLK